MGSTKLWETGNATKSKYLIEYESVTRFHSHERWGTGHFRFQILASRGCKAQAKVARPFNSSELEFVTWCMFWLSFPVKLVVGKLKVEEPES